MVHFRDTLHVHNTVIRNNKVFRHHMIRVAPRVVRSVDIIVIDERGVAAAVDECGGVRARFKRDGRTAVGDDG